MPSPRTKKKTSAQVANRSKTSGVKASVRATNGSTNRASKSNHALFIPFVILIFILWTVYRSLFAFPVWFDESIGKAVFFGFPVLLYITITGFAGISESVSLRKFKQGVLQGLAFGGIFGFAAAAASIVSTNKTVIPVPFFESGIFWFEFGLALLTGVWESIFFFGFIMTVIQYVWSHWSLAKQVMVVALIFGIFHVPAILVQYAGVGSLVGYIFLVTAFGAGQAFLYARNQNLYTLMVVHAIWGMTLLVHTL